MFKHCSSSSRIFRVLYVGTLAPLLVTAEANIEVRVGKTVEITSAHRYCWFPTVHQFPTGEIMVGMRMSPDEWHPEGEFSAYCPLRDLRRGAEDQVARATPGVVCAAFVLRL